MEKIDVNLDEEKGELFTFNPVVALPRGQIAWLQRKYESAVGPVADNIMYEGARKFAYEGVMASAEEFITSILGAILSKDGFSKELLKQFAEWGQGRGEFVELNMFTGHGKIRIYNSFNAEGYKDSDKPVCHFIRGMFAGTASIIGKIDMHCIETKCIAMGDEFCEFEFMPQKDAEE